MFECPVFVFREDNHGSAAYKGTRPPPPQDYKIRG